MDNSSVDGIHVYSRGDEILFQLESIVDRCNENFNRAYEGIF